MGAYWRVGLPGKQYEDRLKRMTSEQLMNEVDEIVMAVSDEDKWFFIECELQKRIGWEGDTNGRSDI